MFFHCFHLVSYRAGCDVNKALLPQHAARYATRVREAQGVVCWEMTWCRHITSNVSLCLNHDSQLVQSTDLCYSCSCLLKYTNTSQNVPHVLGESLVESLDEAYQRLANATEDFGITDESGAITQQCRRSQLLSPPYHSSGVILTEARSDDIRFSVPHFLRCRPTNKCPALARCSWL